MSPKKIKPQWWQLYAMLPVLVGAFLLEMRLPFTNTEHIIAQLAILWLIYMYVHLWLRANRRALMGLDEDPDPRQGEWRIRVYEIAPKELLKHAGGAPVLQMPQAGLKGVLSTTFDIDEQDPDSVFAPRPELPCPEDALQHPEIPGAKAAKDSHAR